MNRCLTALLLTTYLLISGYAEAQPTQPYFPADNNPADFVISEEEYEAYAEAWRTGQPWPEHNDGLIPVDFVTRAAYIRWDFEGVYHTIPNAIGSNPSNYYGGSYGAVFDTIGGGNTAFTVGLIHFIEDYLTNTYTRLETPDTPDLYWDPALVAFDISAYTNYTACAVEIQLLDDWHFVANRYGNDAPYYYDLETRTLRYGPDNNLDDIRSAMPSLISMAGEVLPDIEDVNAAVSVDGSSEVIDYDIYEPYFRDLPIDSLSPIGVPHQLRPGLAILERALAGDFREPRFEFEPEFIPFFDEDWHLNMKVRLVRDALFPEMAFSVERSIDMGEWEALEVFWDLVEVNENKLTFEATFSCIDDGSVEAHRVVINEVAEEAKLLERTYYIGWGEVFTAGQQFNSGKILEFDPIMGFLSTYEDIQSFQQVWNTDDLTNAALITVNGITLKVPEGVDLTTTYLSSVKDEVLTFTSDLADEARAIAEKKGYELEELANGLIELKNARALQLYDYIPTVSVVPQFIPTGIVGDTYEETSPIKLFTTVFVGDNPPSWFSGFDPLNFGLSDLQNAGIDPIQSVNSIIDLLGFDDVSYFDFGDAGTVFFDEYGSMITNATTLASLEDALLAQLAINP